MVPEADLLVTGARLWSDGARVRGADALAVADGRVLALGRTADLVPLAGPRTRSIDARGATVTPGLHDAHLHLVTWAKARRWLFLGDANTREAALHQVREYASRHADRAVILGRGWNDGPWQSRPERRALDAACAGRPIMLWAHDDHSLWVNTAALEAAGIGRDTPDPEGGRIERDATGEATGVVREHAVRLFSELETRADTADPAAALDECVPDLFSMGITAVHDFENEAAMREVLALTRRLPLRVLMHLTHRGLDDALRLGLQSGTGDDRFRIGHVKLFADGTLGSRTAALLEPFDGTDTTGMDLIAPAELRKLVARAFKGGLSVAVHAIGDRASRSALDAFEAGLRASPAPLLAPRVEHVQLLHRDDVPRFAGLGVAASVQPVHCTSDIDLAERYWHGRRELSYPWRSLLDSGAALAFGSDAPIEHPDPSAGLHAALTRQRADGSPPGGYVPDQRVTLDESLRAYTEGPARLSGSWPRLGRLAPGAWADLVVWQNDLHALAPAELLHARPAVTVIEGTVVFEGPDRQGPASGGSEERRMAVGVEGR